MKRFAIIYILVISISACSPGKLYGPTLTLSPTTTPIPSNTPTPTQTPTSTPTSTLTPTPTQQLPVTLGIPLPDVREPIRVDNVSQLQMLANYERYDLAKALVKLTPDGKYYFVVAGGGVVSLGGIDVYDAQSGLIVQHYPIFQRNLNYKYEPNDLQISADRSRFMVRTSNTVLTVYNLEGQEIYSFTFPEYI